MKLERTTKQQQRKLENMKFGESEKTKNQIIIVVLKGLKPRKIIAKNKID